MASFPSSDLGTLNYLYIDYYLSNIVQNQEGGYSHTMQLLLTFHSLFTIKIANSKQLRHVNQGFRQPRIARFSPHLISAAAEK